MHVIGQDFSVKGGVAKALIKAGGGGGGGGGDSIVRKCKANLPSFRRSSQMRGNRPFPL
jgi:hypothetical protein